MDPLPAVAVEKRMVFPKVQTEAVPEMLAVGKAYTVTENGVDVKEQPWLLVIVAVYEPAVEAG